MCVLHDQSITTDLYYAQHHLVCVTIQFTALTTLITNVTPFHGDVCIEICHDMLYNILNIWNFFNEESHCGEPDYAFCFTLYIPTQKSQWS